MSGTNLDARVGGTYSSALGAANAMGGAMNIPELIMAIQIERGNILDGQIRDQMADMQKRNEWLRDANAALNAIRANRPDKEDGKADLNNIKFTDASGKQQSAAEFLKANGIDFKGGSVKQADVDQAIANMKSSIDTVNSQSQMDMVRLQGLMDKRNQAMDLITNTLSKSGKSMDSIIGNMR